MTFEEAVKISIQKYWKDDPLSKMDMDKTAPAKYNKDYMTKLGEEFIPAKDEKVKAKKITNELKGV